MQKLWLLVGMFGVVAIMVLTQVHCGDEGSFPSDSFEQWREMKQRDAQQNSEGDLGTVSTASIPSTDSLEVKEPAGVGGYLATQQLCVDSKSSMDGEVYLFPSDDGEVCLPDRNESPFRVLNEWPQKVLLTGEERSQYCVRVERLAGYITISHEGGMVAREGDIFTWCVTTNGEDAEEMIIRSLTPEATVRLRVP